MVLNSPCHHIIHSLHSRARQLSSIMQESQIAELQSVFGTILTLSKRTKTSPTPETSNYPRWTGSFRLFDFPREIRDCVYYWYLYEPKGLKYTRTGSRHLTFPFTDSRHVVLFLTSCQVYEEALEVFCRFNAIEITNTWRLEGTLRLFPDRPAQMIQRIQLIYRHTYYKSHWRRKNRVSGAWAQMILEAQVAKSYFPMLREFRALWYCSTNSFELEEGLKLQSEAPEVTTEMLLGWMRFLVSRGQVDTTQVAESGLLELRISRSGSHTAPVRTRFGDVQSRGEGR